MCASLGDEYYKSNHQRLPLKGFGNRAMWKIPQSGQKTSQATCMPQEILTAYRVKNAGFSTRYLQPPMTPTLDNCNADEVGRCSEDKEVVLNPTHGGPQ